MRMRASESFRKYATSGAAAGAAGEFALVVGIDRGGNRTALLDAGADLVVDDLDETVAALGVSA